MSRVRIEGSVFFIWSLYLLVLPVKWLFAAVGAACIHELFHWAAVRLTGGQVTRLTIRPMGAAMETGPMEKWQMIVCTAAGPIGSLLLIFFLYRFPRLALCGLVQGFFNLLPIFPLDGGRLLRTAVRNNPCK